MRTRSGAVAMAIVILALMAVVGGGESDEPTSTPEPTAAPTQAADVPTLTATTWRPPPQ